MAPGCAFPCASACACVCSRRHDHLIAPPLALLPWQIDSFEREVVEYVKPNHGTTTLGFIFQGGVIIAVDSRASQGSYICEQRPSARAVLPGALPRSFPGGRPAVCSQLRAGLRRRRFASHDAVNVQDVGRQTLTWPMSASSAYRPVPLRPVHPQPHKR